MGCRRDSGPATAAAANFREIPTGIETRLRESGRLVGFGSFLPEIAGGWNGCIFWLATRFPKGFPGGFHFSRANLPSRETQIGWRILGRHAKVEPPDSTFHISELRRLNPLSATSRLMQARRKGTESRGQDQERGSCQEPKLGHCPKNTAY